jgi:hypothetical protein
MERRSELKVQVILHKNADKCDLNLETIEWRQFNNAVWYGSFVLKKDKYIHTTSDVNYTADASVSVHCSPIIWTKESLNALESKTPRELSDVDWIAYTSHPDYWYAEVIFKLESNDHTIQSYTITPLKWGYEIWVIATTDADLNAFRSDLENFPANLNRPFAETEIIEMID